MQRIQRIAAFVVCAALSSSLAFAADETQERISAVKASIVTRFVNYIDWPDKGASATICVAGNGGMSDVFRKVAAAVMQKNPGTQLSISEGSGAGKGCRVIFFAQSEAGRYSSALSGAGSQVLTVGDIRGFAKQGGMVELVVDQEKVKFIVNLQAIKSAGLGISPDALDAAAEVIGR